MFNKMSIRNKLIILFISLLALLLAFQGFLYLQYDDKVSERLGKAAFEVSKDTASVFIYNQDILFTEEVLTLDDNGQLTQQKVFLPGDGKIQMRLVDNIKDQSIKLINDDSVFQIPIPRNQVHDTIGELKKRNLWITFILFTIALTLVTLITYSITKPLLALNKAAKRISLGELGTQVDLDATKYGKDVSDTIKQFNSMSSQLVNYQKEQNSKQELEHFKELGSISRGLAHNLRNPLNTLQLSIEQLESKHSSPQSDALTMLAKSQVERIEQWLQTFTLLMEQGIEKQSVKLSKLITLAAQDFDDQLLDISTNPDYLINCVEAEFTMILQILIQNALESYKNEQSNKNEITINTSINSDSLEIIISDQGSGVSKSIQESLFKPYSTNKTYGSGMGLFISRRLIKHRYSGEMSLQNNKDKGAKAIIKLPAQGFKHV